MSISGFIKRIDDMLCGPREKRIGLSRDLILQLQYNLQPLLQWDCALPPRRNLLLLKYLSDMLLDQPAIVPLLFSLGSHPGPRHVGIISRIHPNTESPTGVYRRI